MSEKSTSSEPAMIPGRESARVYVGKFDNYREDISPRTRTAIERMLYNYAYILKGNDLYTGTIRPDSYTMKRSSPTDGSFDAHMTIDIAPTNVSYVVSVTKDKSTDYIEGYSIICAPKSEQKDKTAVCKDEQGR